MKCLKLSNLNKPRVLGLAVETDDYFIINRNEHTYLYMVTVNILKAFLLPIFILTRLSKKDTGSLSFFSMLIFIVYFAAFAGVSYALFTNVLVKDGTIQSVELIRSIMIWFALLFAIIVFVHKD
jgi:hypothetical protein